MTDGSPDVAIVGGGICGLTTALALERRGLTPTVYEAASEYRPVGAGILLQTNALLVFERLGIVDRVREAGNPLEDTVIRGPGGRALKRFDLNRVERREFGYGFVAIHRADLQRILLEELETDVRTGMACEAVLHTDPPTARFEDGTEIAPDVLVGADGIGSAVRDAVVPDVEPESLGNVAYRAVTEVELPEQHCARGVEVWGEGTYTGGAPIGEDRFYWFATAPGSDAAEASPTRRTVSRLRERFADFPAPVPAVVESLDAEDVFVTGLADVPSLDRWHRGSVVVAGDAAHGMLPFAGQGAAQAIEDGIALAHALDTHRRPPAAFESFADRRRTRANRVRTESHRLGALATVHSRLGARARNLAASLFPDAAFRRFRRQRIDGTTLPEPAVSN